MDRRSVTAAVEGGEQRRLSKWWRPTEPDVEAVVAADVAVVRER